MKAHAGNKFPQNKVTKKSLWLGNILNTVKKNLSRLKLTVREKIELEVIHISIKTHVLHYLKTQKHTLYDFLPSLTLIFSRMLEN